MEFKEDTDDTEDLGSPKRWLKQWLIGPGGKKKIVGIKLEKLARKIESDI